MPMVVTVKTFYLKIINIFFLKKQVYFSMFEIDTPDFLVPIIGISK